MEEIHSAHDVTSGSARAERNSATTIVMWTWMILVAVLHVVLAVSAYYARVQQLGPIWQSDLLVLYLPMLTAFVAYATILWKHATGPSSRLVRVTRVAFAAAFATYVSSAMAYLIAFNQWGT